MSALQSQHNRALSFKNLYQGRPGSCLFSVPWPALSISSLHLAKGGFQIPSSGQKGAAQGEVGGCCVVEVSGQGAREDAAFPALVLNRCDPSQLIESHPDLPSKVDTLLELLETGYDMANSSFPQRAYSGMQLLKKLTLPNATVVPVSAF